jgi:hypothetical protein
MRNSQNSSLTRLHDPFKVGICRDLMESDSPTRHFAGTHGWKPALASELASNSSRKFMRWKWMNRLIQSQ